MRRKKEGERCFQLSPCHTNTGQAFLKLSERDPGHCFHRQVIEGAKILVLNLALFFLYRAGLWVMDRFSSGTPRGSCAVVSNRLLLQQSRFAARIRVGCLTGLHDDIRVLLRFVFYLRSSGSRRHYRQPFRPKILHIERKQKGEATAATRGFQRVLGNVMRWRKGGSCWAGSS